MRAIFGAKYALFCLVTTPSDPLPTDLASAHAMILAQRALLEQEQSARIMAQSEVKVRALEIERLKLLLAKARREQFGQSSERGKLLIEQLELAIEDLEETQGQTLTPRNSLSAGSTVPTLSTVDIAVLTGKRHDHVLADVEKMLRELKIPAPNFRGSYFGDNGRESPLYNLPERECYILVSGYHVGHRK